MTAALDTQSPTPPEGQMEELLPGTDLLRGQYRIDRFLNSGGFGLTYLARDSLGRRVVIKECFPDTLCTRSGLDVQARSRAQDPEFDAIVELFIDEAHRLAWLDHPNIVGVHQVFTDNSTAYMALDFVDGKTLLEIIEDARERPSPAQIEDMLRKLLDAVAFVHDRSLLHRDISPDNILIERDGNPVLIDFGAARERATRTSRVLSRMQVVKDGYSPQEFYVAGIRQGPASDLYGLAASFHHLIAGAAPPNSQIRTAALAAGDPDPYQPLAGRIDGLPRTLLASIDLALNVIPRDRPQSARDWLALLDAAPPRPAAGPAPAEAPDPVLDSATRSVISRLVDETNRAVAEARRLAEEEARSRGPAEPPRPPARRRPFAWRTLDDEDEVTATAPGPATPNPDRAPDPLPAEPDTSLGTAPAVRPVRRLAAAAPQAAPQTAAADTLAGAGPAPPGAPPRPGSGLFGRFASGALSRRSRTRP
ncbi:hypothetical protein BYZ73_02080 [Rhodovulum viride]|uniref:Protein kinase domain-containing protein n=1 Tax=Rhodovulum viride TaxID=1231134 RepID=A0ABX9DML4_9RHOB|nr:serine/threonine-protein kinase [Rhodovulum viride]RAP42989.1 hypothetical protein BYZ73_02080 [Rhodovulum viride]